MTAPPSIFTNPTLDWMWSFALELPAYVAARYLIEIPSIGRRGVGGGGLVMGGVLLLLISFKGKVENGFFNYTLDVIYYPARMGIAAAYGVAYPWTAEFFPS